MSALFKPVSLLAGVGAGVVAALVFRQTWKLISGDDDAPAAIDEHRRLREVIAAAALQGAIFAVAKAVFERGGAATFRQITGSWPH